MQSRNDEKFSLRENCRTRFLKDVLGKVREGSPSDGDFILILDQSTTKIISSLVTTFDLLSENVLLLENLQLVRKPFPTISAIYFITPSADSIDRMLKDFKDAKTQMYLCAHVFFTDPVSSTLMTTMKSHKYFSSVVRTLQIVNLNFSCPYENEFSLDMQATIPRIFSQEELNVREPVAQEIASKLATLIPNLLEYKKIHIIHGKNERNDISKRVAELLYSKVKSMVELREKSVEERKDHDSYDEEDDMEDLIPPIKILIVDRAADPLTPLTHDLYYRSLMVDLCNISTSTQYEDVGENGEPVTKSLSFNDEDDLFIKYRYKHIVDCVDGIAKEFKEFIKENKGNQEIETDAQMDAKKMLEIVSKLPIYQELLSKYTGHMSLLDKIIKVSNDFTCW